MLPALLLLLGAATGADQVLVPAGSYRPLYPPDPNEPVVQVGGFRLDKTPVTRAEFAVFLRRHPDWQKGAAPSLFVDDGYLAQWQGTTPPPPAAAPVTQVSWFAARAYCDAQGKRLPTEDEWEYVARASETARDASDDPVWLGRILKWYGSPSGDVDRAVGKSAANAFGVHDMHGLVWEWVDDYNNTVFGTDGRESGDEELLRFCGSGALSATDVKDYANFMRVAFRSSLKGSYTTKNLGFRCASGGVH